MKKRFTEEQIIKILNRNRNGKNKKAIGREFGVSKASIYAGKKKFNNMSVSEATRLKELEAENLRLKRLVADQELDIAMLKDVNSKKW